MGLCWIVLLLAGLCEAVRASHQHAFRGVAHNVMQASTSGWPDTIKFATNYYPSQWPRSVWESDAARMANSSITHVRISEFDWALLEPRRGEYDWSLLDESIDVLARYNLSVILGTPTATPPMWLVNELDILGMDDQLHVRRFGSRRHYSFSSPDYRTASRGIVEAFARRYGNHSAVAAWQLDNEYGNSRTARSFDVHASNAFRIWLKNKYGTIAELNRRQGRVFWSSQFTSFDDVLPPTMENEESSPALRLDYFHFSSDELISFAKLHADAIRKVAHQHGYRCKPITTNMMGFEFSFDHFSFVRETSIDFVTWDSYPLGNAEMLPWLKDDQKRQFARTGLPDHQALQHGLFRGLAGYAMSRPRGPWGVMEQQPGPVNWALSNPSPAEGQIRLWLHDMISMGSSLNNIFRWRQVPYGQEQMHAGMLRPDDRYDVAWYEQQSTVRDVQRLTEQGVTLQDKSGVQAKIAIVFDFTSHWYIEAQPQSGRFQRSTFVDYDFQYGEVVSRWHTALRRMAMDVDIIGPWSDLSGYDLILVPAMVNVTDEFASHLQHVRGDVIFGPRTGSKVDPLSIPDGLPPSSAAIRQRLPMKVTRVESLRAGGLGDQVKVVGVEKAFDVQIWSEWLECHRDGIYASEEPEAAYVGYREGQPAMCSHVDAETNAKTTYLGWYADVSELKRIFARAALRKGIGNLLHIVPRADDDDLDLGDYMRIARGGDALFVFNYNDKGEADFGQVFDRKSTDLQLDLIVGSDDVGHKVPKSGVSIYKVTQKHVV
jgi:beta-galactosidase GanA